MGVPPLAAVSPSYTWVVTTSLSYSELRGTFMLTGPIIMDAHIFTSA